MSWISGECQGDRDCKCYYQSMTYPYETWCRDVDGMCPRWDSGGDLVREDCREGDGGW